jgi:hypothetical protein
MLSLAQAYIVSYTGMLIGTMYNAVAILHSWPQAAQTLGWMVLIVVVSQYLELMTDLILEVWKYVIRNDITMACHSIAQSRLIAASSTVDSIDQRICKEPQDFADLFCVVVKSLFIGVLILCYYSICILKLMKWVPVAACTIFFICTLVAFKLFSRPIRNRLNKHELAEGIFRRNTMHYVRSEISLISKDQLDAMFTDALNAQLYQRLLSTVARSLQRFVESLAAPLMYLVVVLWALTEKELHIYDISNAIFLCLGLAFSYSNILSNAVNYFECRGFAIRILDVLDLPDVEDLL